MSREWSHGGDRRDSGRRRRDESEYDRRRERRDSYDAEDDRRRRRDRDDRGYSRDRYDAHDRNGGSRNNIRGQEPTSTIMLRGLTERSTELMIEQALAAFWPKQIRLILDKGTGLSRSFAFAEFGGIEGAQAMMHAYGGSCGYDGPWLSIDGKQVQLEYSEDRSFGTARSGGWPARGGGSGGGSGGGARSDWVCPYCQTMNFARRFACFKCNANKDDNAEHLGAGNPNPDEPTETGIPGPVLVCRGISTRTSEETVHEIFRAFAPLKEVRLVRDKISNCSRGFCFVEFHSTEHATHTLNAATSSDLRIEGSAVRLAYARDAMRSGAAGPISLSNTRLAGSSVGRELAQAALSQAQWGIGNNYSSDQRAASTAAVRAAAADHEAARLARKKAEAAIRAAQQVKQRDWPPSFEEDGAAWTFDANSGYYYEQSSGFYYDVRAKLYYKSATVQYFQHTPTTRPPFTLYIPPPPAAAAAATPVMAPPAVADSATSFLQSVIPTAATPASAGAGGWKAKQTPEAEAKARAEAQMAAFNQTPKSKSKSNSNSNSTSSSAGQRDGSGERGGRGANAGRGGQAGRGVMVGGRGGQARGRGGQAGRGRGGQAGGRGGGGRGGAVAVAVAGAVAAAAAAAAAAGGEGGGAAAGAPASPASAAPPTEVTLEELAKTYAATQASMLFNGRPVITKKDSKWACLLCRRQFAQEDVLRKHVEQSPLHFENFTKFKSKCSVKPLGSIKGAVVGPGTGIVYRNRAQERRSLHGQDDNMKTIGHSRNEKNELILQQQEERQAELASDATQRQAANKINEPIEGDNIGNQMMQKLGWTGGGLGKDQSGIVEPVQAQGTMGKSGVGAESGNGFDSSKIIGSNFKDASRKMARARYEAEFEQGGDDKRPRMSY